MKKRLVLLSLLVLSGPSLAEVVKPKGQASEARSQLVCFSEKVTGSHLRKRICMTEEERERRKAEDQDAMGKLRSSKAGASSRNTGAER